VNLDEEGLPLPGEHQPPEEWGWQDDGIVGIFIGGCVARGVGSSFRRQAHAHNYARGEHYGWICVRSRRRIFMPDGKRPSRLMEHERAHILTPNHGHDDAWRATMRRLGQPIPSHLQKKTRTR
jgi:hypothetical protein